MKPLLLREVLLGVCRNACGRLLPIAIFCGIAYAQQPTLVALHTETAAPMAPAPAVEPAAVSNRIPEAPSPHRFFDRENRLLFSIDAGLCTADFFTTHANLAAGGRELNPITRLFSGTTPGLALNFVGESASVVGVSYLFHRTGHHKLERLTPITNIAASAFAVAFDLAHRR